jgi:hypothetical protein
MIEDENDDDADVCLLRHDFPIRREELEAYG